MRLTLSLAATAVFAFPHAPLAVLALFSFNASRFTVWEGFSLGWYRAALRDQTLAEAAGNSLLIALVSAAVATAAGTLAAYGMWKRQDRILLGSLYLSLVTPEIVMGVALLALFQFAFRWLDLQLGMFTVVLAHVAFSLAFVVIVVSARLRTLDRSLEEAAMDLGAGEWQAFRLVTLPALTPAILAAALLALTLSFDDYVITSLVAGVDSETLPMWIYAAARRGVSPVLNAISALVVMFFGLVILLSEALQRRSGNGRTR